MGNKTTKISKKALSQGFMVTYPVEFSDSLYLRQKGKRVYLAYSTQLLAKGIRETAVLIRHNGGWSWEKKFDNPSVVRWAESLAVFPNPITGFDNRCNPVKNFRLFKDNWKRIVSLPVPMQETL
jgi:hypothetical protein